MSTAFATAGPSAYWYLTRSTGAVSLVLLTVSVVLGILGSLRFAWAPRWPRFAVDSMHRDVSLLVLVFLAAHIITSVLDTFAPIKVADAVIPFSSSYRPLWIGLGALSFDLLVALVITSLLRRRLGYSAWRAIHWLAYASWPVAVLHGLGSGSDTKLWWMLALTGACGLAVVVAVWIRLARTQGDRSGLRAPALALSIVAPLGIAIFTLAGPLQRGWARRAGTPVSLLGSAGGPVRQTPVATRSATRTGARPFTATLDGTIRQTSAAGGATVDMSLRFTGQMRGRLRIRLAGAPIPGGGLSLTGSQVDLIVRGLPSVLGGRIVSLQGQQLQAEVSNRSGSTLELRADLNIDSARNAVSGRLAASLPGGAQ
jgi:hypothetical protein